MRKYRNRSLVRKLVSLPWWVSLFVAVIVYALIRYWLVEYMRTEQILNPLSVWVGQYAYVPSIYFLAIMIWSAVRSWRLGSLLNSQTSLESLKKLSWRKLEYLVAEAYRRKGYKVQENYNTGADGGVDVIISKKGIVTYIQCKHWRDKVGVKIVRELYGVVNAEGANRAMVVGTSGFTKDAKEFATKTGVILMDGRSLVGLVNQLKKNVRKNVEQQIDNRPSAADIFDTPVLSNPECSCGRIMVKRITKRGANKGKVFWGCSAYPDCKETRSVQG